MCPVATFGVRRDDGNRADVQTKRTGLQAPSGVGVESRPAPSRGGRTGPERRNSPVGQQLYRCPTQA